MIHRLLHVMIMATAILSTNGAATKRALQPGSIMITPHYEYQSLEGVVGCKINTNRVTHWPYDQTDCNDLCVKVTHSSSRRSVNLLRVGMSTGAYDISYDAYNYLVTGQSATVHPIAGGPVRAVWEPVGMDECQDLIFDDEMPKGSKRLPFVAYNVAFVQGCPPGSYVAQNSILWNYGMDGCQRGIAEQCSMPAPGHNEAVCPSGERFPQMLMPDSERVQNIAYPVVGGEYEAGTLVPAPG